jgi:hypothetical protein
MPNAPFTPTVNTEWIRQLPDGSNITLKNHRTIARDAQGRVFQERRYFVPDDGKHESTITQIEISDPATLTSATFAAPRSAFAGWSHSLKRIS